jgi:hypothetical protein
MENILIFAFGVACGVIFYRAAVLLGAAWYGAAMFRMVELQCLQLLALSLEDATFMKYARLQMMEKVRIYNKSQIKIIQNEDRYNLQSWKENSIDRLIGRYPENYRKSLRYHDWSTAMEYLNAHVEKVLDR